MTDSEILSEERKQHAPLLQCTGDAPTRTAGCSGLPLFELGPLERTKALPSEWKRISGTHATFLFFSQREKPGKKLKQAFGKACLVLSVLPPGDCPFMRGMG